MRTYTERQETLERQVEESRNALTQVAKIESVLEENRRIRDEQDKTRGELEKTKTGLERVRSKIVSVGESTRQEQQRLRDEIKSLQ